MTSAPETDAVRAALPTGPADASSDQPVHRVRDAVRSAWRRGIDELRRPRDRAAFVVFLALAIPIGVTFALLIPPSQVLDEESHFLRAWQLAELNLRSDIRFDEPSAMDRNGAVYDACVPAYIGELAEIAATPAPYSYRSFWFDTPDCSPRRREYVITDAAVSYGPWSYPGQVAGLAIARVAGAPLPVTFFLGRLAGLAVYIGAVALALRLAPAARLAMLFVALLPSSMMSAAAYSADGVMIAGSLLAIACALRFALDDVERPRRLLAVMVAALGFVIATKPNYMILLGLLLLVPPRHFGDRRRGQVLLCAAGLAIAAFAAAWYVIGKGAPTAELFYAGVDPGEQTRSLVGDPLGFLDDVWDTLFSYPYEVFFLRGWVGIYGMQRSGRPEIPPLLPVPFVFVALAVLVVAIVVEAGSRRELDTRARWWRGSVSAAISVLGPVSVFAAAFLLWTAPGAPFIEGVQGRYMLPFVPMAAAGLALTHHRSNLAVTSRAVGVTCFVLAIASIDKMLTLFY
jgi:uncharacterized membrane protein